MITFYCNETNYCFFLEKSKFPFFFFSSGNQSFADSIGGRLRPKTYKNEKRKKLQKKLKIDMNQKESAFFIAMKSMRHKLFSNIFVRQKEKCSRTFISILLPSVSGFVIQFFYYSVLKIVTCLITFKSSVVKVNTFEAYTMYIFCCKNLCLNLKLFLLRKDIPNLPMLFKWGILKSLGIRFWKPEIRFIAGDKFHLGGICLQI
jgi:hypothetical protein